MEEGIRASRLIGMQVITSDGRRIGAFSDLVFFPETRGIPLGIVSYGGIAGFRRKRRAIRFRWVRFRRGVPFLRLRINWEEWKRTPEFEGFVPSAQDVKEILADMPDDSSGGAGERRLTGARDGSDGGSVNGREPRDGIRWREADSGEHGVPCVACVALGMAAVGNDYGKIGVVRDLVIDVELGRIRRLVLAFGGVLGFGSETRLVGAKGLEVDFEFDQVRLPFAGKELLGGKRRRT